MRQGLGLAVLALLAALWAGCSGASPEPTATNPRLTSTGVPTPTATAIPTPAPAATASPVPATETAIATLVPPPESSEIDVQQLSEIAIGYLTELSETLSPRESATGLELAAAEYLAGQFERIGYTAEVQPFTVEVLSREQSGLTLNMPGPERIDAVPMVRSGRGQVSGMLAPVGLASVGEIPPEGLEGKIALARRGTITFEEKVTRAGEAGAIGVVVYNNQPGGFMGTLSSVSSIPAVGISQEDGRRIEELIAAGEVEATLSVVVDSLLSRNVIAEKPGPGEEVVVLGAHYDTVADIMGANDNGSGTAVLLTLAEELWQENSPFTVRFVAFGSEELGLRGSRFYVESLSTDELGRVVAMLNLDALGSGRRLEIVGTGRLGSRVADLGDRADIALRRTGNIQGATSDHATFTRAGIPAIMFSGSDFSRIHTTADTLEFIEPRLLGEAASLALALLRTPDFWLE